MARYGGERGGAYNERGIMPNYCVHFTLSIVILV